MFVCLILLFLIQNTDSTSSESSVLNDSTEGSDAVNFGNPKVCYDFSKRSRYSIIY